MQEIFPFLAVALPAAFVCFFLYLRFTHRRIIDSKYEFKDDVRRILKKELWIGETLEQVVDSFGQPEDIEEKVSQTKTRRILKYGRDKKMRFRLVIVVENGLVVGWNRKPEQ